MGEDSRMGVDRCSGFFFCFFGVFGVEVSKVVSYFREGRSVLSFKIFINLYGVR